MVKMAVDWEYERRRNSKLHRLRRHAGLAQPAADIADIKALPGRNVDAELIARLAVGNYLQNRQDVILQGPTGAGKTYVACALGNKACQQYRSVLYLPAGELIRPAHHRRTHRGAETLPGHPGQGGVVDHR